MEGNDAKGCNEEMDKDAPNNGDHDEDDGKDENKDDDSPEGVVDDDEAKVEGTDTNAKGAQTAIEGLLSLLSTANAVRKENSERACVITPPSSHNRAATENPSKVVVSAVHVKCQETCQGKGRWRDTIANATKGCIEAARNLIDSAIAMISQPTPSPDQFRQQMASIIKSDDSISPQASGDVRLVAIRQLTACLTERKRQRAPATQRGLTRTMSFHRLIKRHSS